MVNAKHLAQIVRITVSHNFADGQAPRNCTLLLRKEEQTLGNFAIDTASPHQIIDLPKKQLPAGVLTFSLIDPAGHIYAERLVMARYPETASPDIHAKVNHDETLRQLHIEFTTPKGEKAEAGTYSIAIVEEAWDNTPDRYHLASYQALGGHLRGDIPDIGRYWRPDDEKSLLDIDLLLLTHGWRRYSLANIRHEADTRAEGFHMEQSLSLTGRVNARKSQAEGMVVQAIVRKDTTQQVVICPVDEELRFSLNGFHFTGWSEVLLSAKNGESKEFPIEIDKPAESPTASPFDRQTVWTVRETGTTQTVTVEADTILISPQEMMRHVQVSEVEVTANKRDPIEKRRKYSTEFVKVSFEAPKQGFAGDIRRLMQRIPGIRMVSPPSEQGFIKPPKAVINGYPNRAYATLVLNGMVIRDDETVYSMDAANVERIEVLQPTATMFGGMNSKNGIICIYTRLGGGEPIDPTRTIHQWIGYNQVKEFYAPHPGNREFFANPRRRHTLYWNPQITTDEQGNAQFSIYLNDAENGRYTLHCEGYTESGRTVTINTAIIF